MPDEKLDNRNDDELRSALKSRFGDLVEQRDSGPAQGERGGSNRWAVIKDRLAIVVVILVLAFLVFMMMEGSFVNFAALSLSSSPSSAIAGPARSTPRSGSDSTTIPLVKEG